MNLKLPLITFLIVVIFFGSIFIIENKSILIGKKTAVSDISTTSLVTSNGSSTENIIIPAKIPATTSENKFVTPPITTNFQNNDNCYDVPSGVLYSATVIQNFKSDLISKKQSGGYDFSTGVKFDPTKLDTLNTIIDSDGFAQMQVLGDKPGVLSGAFTFPNDVINLTIVLSQFNALQTDTFTVYFNEEKLVQFTGRMFSDNIGEKAWMGPIDMRDYAGKTGQLTFVYNSIGTNQTIELHNMEWFYGKTEYTQRCN